MSSAAKMRYGHDMVKPFLEYGRHVRQLRHHCLAYVYTSNTASHDNHDKINTWVSFSFLYEHWALLGSPELHRYKNFLGKIWSRDPSCKGPTGILCLDLKLSLTTAFRNSAAILVNIVIVCSQDKKVFPTLLLFLLITFNAS